MLSQLLYGGQPSLLAGFVPTVIATIIGTVIGTWLGYKRGASGTVLMRGMDMLYAVPAILIAKRERGVARRRAAQRDPRRARGVHPTDRAHRGVRDPPGRRARVHGGGAAERRGVAAAAAHPRCCRTC
jgi:hypothetical protein